VHVANVPKQPALENEKAFTPDPALTGDYANGGNYDGFVVYDISEPGVPQVVSTARNSNFGATSHCRGASPKPRTVWRTMVRSFRFPEVIPWSRAASR